MNLLVSATALLVASVSIVAYDVVTFRDEMVQNLGIQAQIVGSNAVSALLFNDDAAADATLAALAGAPSIMAAAIYRPNGELFASYRRPSDVEAIVPVRAPTDEPTRIDWLVSPGIQVVRPIAFQNTEPGLVYIRSDFQEMFTRLTRYAVIVTAVLAAALLAALGISRVAQRSVSAPMATLAALAQRVSHERDYSIRATGPVSGREVRVLTSAFNEMLAQIEERDASLQESRTDLEQRVAERTAALTTINSELESFSYSVSHDLRAPVRHISGFVTLLRSQLGASCDPESQRYLTVIGTAAERMGRLIDDLLAFSRMGRAPLAKKEVHLDDLTRDAKAEVLLHPTDRAITWTMHPMPSVRADPTMLRAAMVNLLANAVKYTGTRAHATIEIGIAPSADHETVVFVRDNGVGFDMQYVGKLFGVFQRLHSADEFEGTGIGLANVRRVIHRHGGRVWAESVKDAGATFYFSLPAEVGLLPHDIGSRGARSTDDA